VAVARHDVWSLVKLSNLSIGKRLVLAFGVVIVSLVVLTGIGVIRVQEINTRLGVINDQNSVKQRYAINFRCSVHDRAISLRDVVLAKTPAEAQPEIAQIDKLAAKYADSALKMNEMFADGNVESPAESAALADIQRIETQTMPQIQQVITLRMAGDTTQALDLLVQTAKPSFVSWLAAINKLIDLEESMNGAQTKQARAVGDGFLITMGLLCALSALIAAVIGWRIIRSISAPLNDAVEVLAAVADGDLTRRLNVESNDEMGRMGRSMNAALATISEVMPSFGRTAAGVASISERIATLSDRIAGGASESSAQTHVVAGAATEVSRSVQTVAAGSREMGDSIREIAHSTTEAAMVANEAVATVESTTATVARLGDSSRMIGDVVKAITAIAAQTNLLALNATIEAARAGESGKGFAVVANEVKELSQETARATEDISRRVVAIQADSSSAAEAIAEVARVISKINDYQTTIASAVEEQTATTNEMNRSLAEAAAGSGQIAGNIGGVAAVVQSTTESAGESQRAAADLSVVSAELQSLVGRFRY
jgi:methyl-accepting chemotaxis protein